MTDKYNWTDDPTVSGESICDTDILNDCLMHLKYDHSSGSGLSMFDIVAKDHVLSYQETKGLALLGTWVYKEPSLGVSYGYPDFYAKCLAERDDSALDVVSTNIAKVGSPVVENGEISGFSSANYAKTPGVPAGVTSYEIVAKFRTGALDGTQQGIIANSTTNIACPQIIISPDNILKFDHPDTSTSWVLPDITFSSLQSNTTYYVSMDWNGTTVTCKYKMSKDAEWIVLGTMTTSTVNWAEAVGIGIDTPEFPFKGSIDLKESYININGARWWTGADVAYKNANGHVYYDVADKFKIDRQYDETGVAWCYIIDETNERVFLPRNDYFFQSGAAADVGKFIEAGVPNVNGSAYMVQNQSPGGTGAFYNEIVTYGYKSGGNVNVYAGLVGFDASRSSNLYGKSDTVQPAAVKMVYYMVVGNTEETKAIIDVTEVTTSANDTIPLFAPQYFNFKPTNVSWLKAGTQKNSGGIYGTVYNTLVSCLTEANNVYELKVIDVAEMVVGTDYSEYWQVDQTAMTFTTPTKVEDNVPEGLYLYFKVANAVQNLELLDAGEVTEALSDCLTVGNKAEIVSWGIPDYSAGVSISGEYQAEYDCYVIAQAAGSTMICNIVINGLTIAAVGLSSQGAGDGATIGCFAGKGDVITGAGALKVYPLKGVN